MALPSSAAGGPHERRLSLTRFSLAYGAPAGFGAAAFEPKAYDGLGSIAGAEAAAALARIEAAVAAVPVQPAGAAGLWQRTWPACVDALTAAFAEALWADNPAFGLHESAVEFAIAGFRDALTAYGFACVRAAAAKMPLPAFADVYAAWVEESRRTSSRVFTVEDRGWSVRIINDVFGRAGLHVEGAAAEPVEVEDRALACPAAAWTERLLARAAAQLVSEPRV